MADFVTADGVTLFYECHGRGPRIYVLHGGPANDFRYMADNLAPLFDEFEFVFHDYRGSGRSENADPSKYTVEQLAADLDELRAELGDERITVVAHSMGGLIALPYAARCSPGAANAWSSRAPSPRRRPKRGSSRRSAVLGWARTTKMVSRRGPADCRVQLALRCRGPAGADVRHLGDVARRRAGCPRRGDRGERRLGLPFDNDNATPLRKTFPSIDFAPRLREISCPVLVLYGARDAMSVWSAGEFRKGLPDVTVTELAGIGHDVFFEAPDATATAIRRFM